MKDSPTRGKSPEQLAELLAIGRLQDDAAPETSAAEDEETPPERDLLPTGTRIGDYEIICKIGSGGMGVVYKAYEHALKRIVALKVLHRQLLSNASLAKRFWREAVLAANLSHPNIVPVFHVDQQAVPPYFAMEFVQGRSVKDKIEAGGFLQPEEAIRIALQACDALQYAHKNNIIHRDVKPANMLLQNHLERVRITDFGIAQDLTGRLGELTKTEGITAGTLAFMSPEQNLGHTLDARTDVFSLGMTLYYMLTGQTAYRARNRAELALAFQGQSAVPPSRFNPQVSPALDAIVLRMIAVDSAKRYSTCEAAADDLRRVEPSSSISAVPRVRTRCVFRTRYALIGLAVVAVLLVAVTGAYFLRPPAHSEPGILFREDFHTLNGWTSAGNSKGILDSDGEHAYVRDWQSGDQVIAEKRLLRPISPDMPFSVELRFRVSADAPNSVGGLMIALLDEKDSVVAKIGWHDAQAAAGFGGVDFYAQEDKPIYRTDPSGFGKEFPIFDGVLRLERSGSEWTAWVNNKRTGSPVVLRPTLTASKVRVAATRAMGWFPREFEISGITVTTNK